MKIHDNFVRLFIAVIMVLSIACGGSDNSSDNSSDSSNEDKLVFKDGEPTLIEGNLPEKTAFFILNNYEGGAPLELTGEKIYINDPDKNGFYSFNKISDGLFVKEFIQHIKEIESGEKFSLRIKGTKGISNYELRKLKEDGRWIMEYLDDSGGWELADNVWIKSFAKNKRYTNIHDKWGNIEYAGKLINKFIKDKTVWAEVIKKDDKLVLLTECETEPVKMQFQINGYDGSLQIIFNTGTEESEYGYTVNMETMNDYGIYFHCMDFNDKIKELQIFFIDYSVKINNVFKWEELILKEKAKPERVFVPEYALDRYPVDRIPCEGENEKYPDLDKLLNQKWVQVDEDDHNKIIYPKEKVLVEKKDGYYFFDGKKVCSFDEEIYTIDCKAENGCFELNVENDILNYFYRPWCANVNDSKNTFYKKVK